MKVTAISIVPPVGTEQNPALTNELLASVLAKYSRSNDGLDKILSKVDIANPEKSIAAIFKFVDYGHASIGGLTGGIPIVLDGVSVWMAYKLFEISQRCDGQESSTRYITMDATGLIPAVDLGFEGEAAEKLDAFGKLAIETYRSEYARLDALATANPEIVRYPAGASDKVKERIRKNFALDRARYFLPNFLRTNIAIVQTARDWAETISALYSSPQLEAQDVAAKLVEALRPYSPNLLRHACQKPGWTKSLSEEITEAAICVELEKGVSHTEAPANTSVFCNPVGPIGRNLSIRANRYDRAGRFARLTTVEVEWTGMAFAEARDINRHRTGERFYLTTHQGFYLPEEVRSTIDKAVLEKFIEAHREVLAIGKYTVFGVESALLPYTLVLGSQGTFYRSTTLAKFAYEIELRTGPGAHFRYAKHYRDALEKLYERLDPFDRGCIPTGEGEPE